METTTQIEEIPAVESETARLYPSTNTCVRCRAPIDVGDLVDGARACWECREKERRILQAFLLQAGSYQDIRRRYAHLIEANSARKLPAVFTIRGVSYSTQHVMRAAMAERSNEADRKAVLRDLYYLSEYLENSREPSLFDDPLPAPNP